MHLLQVILEFSIVLGIMVLVHEFGHFAVAKLCGVRIEAFSIGMGPRLFGIRHNGTDYKICALPIGGFVKMAGEYGAETSAAAPDDFTAQPRSNRILIALAGPFSNFILSFFLLFLAAHYHHEVDKYLNGPAVVDYVPVNTPAAHIGLAGGDVITHFNNVENPTWEQIFYESELNLNRTLPIRFTHNGHTVSSDILIATTESSEITGDAFSPSGLLPRMQPGPISIASIAGNTPAERAGLKPGDLIARVDNFEPHSVSTLHAYLKDRGGAPAVVSVLRNGQTLTFNITPEAINTDQKSTEYQIGFSAKLAPVDIERLPLGAAIKQSLKDNRDNSTLALRTIKGLFTRHVSVKQMSGPVGIAQQIDVATRLGIWTLISFVALISLQLGIFNLLPVPILDGGMILFLLIESVIRKDVNLEVKERVYQVAFVCIILFACFVLFNDISKLHLGGR